MKRLPQAVTYYKRDQNTSEDDAGELGEEILQDLGVHKFDTGNTDGSLKLKSAARDTLIKAN